MKKYNNEEETKQNQLKKILTFQNNLSDFLLFDNQLTKKRFSIIEKQSLVENYISSCYLNINQDVFDEIINNFIKKCYLKTFFDKPYIREIIKLTNNKMFSIDKKINIKKLHILVDKIQNLSLTTDYISHDFLLLKLTDNLIIKVKDANIRNVCKNIKKDIFCSFITKEYKTEKKEAERFCYCYIDRLVSACILNEINLNDFVCISKKILTVSDYNLSVLWKMVMSINYLSFNDLYDDSVELRKFKRDVLKKINEVLNISFFSKKEITEVVIRVIASEIYKKEDFYYIFDLLQNQIKTDSVNKLYYLNLIEYLIYSHHKRSIFHKRFIREAFFNLLVNISQNEDSSIILEKLLFININLFHIDIFYHFMKKEIIGHILFLLSKLNSSKKQISKQRFYKCCDVVDYILYKHTDLINEAQLKEMIKEREDKLKILKRFSLYKKASSF